MKFNNESIDRTIERARDKVFEHEANTREELNKIQERMKNLDLTKKRVFGKLEKS